MASVQDILDWFDIVVAQADGELIRERGHLQSMDDPLDALEPSPIDADSYPVVPLR
jgi:hypothetical protein